MEPTLKHVRVFGCICFDYIPKERSKLDDKKKKLCY
jgi:hypothetical protein